MDSAHCRTTLPAIRPLRSVITSIVIDALDECEVGNDIRSILQLLAETNALRTARLQFLLPSRPETPIIFGFRAMPGIIHHGGFIIGIIRQVGEELAQEKLCINSIT